MHQFLKFIFEMKLYMFRQWLCPSSGVFHSIYSNVDSVRTSCQQPVWYIPLLCLQVDRGTLRNM